MEYLEELNKFLGEKYNLPKLTQKEIEMWLVI